MLKKLLVLVVPAAVLMAQASPASADASTGTLFGITGFGQSVLSTIDPASGAVTDIEDLAGPKQGQLVSITGDPTAHRIYAMMSNPVFIPPSTIQVTQELLTIDTLTGATTASPLNPGRLGFLMYDPSAGLLLAADNQNLYSVDPGTGAQIPIVNFNTNPGALFFFAGAVDPSTNTVYVHLNVF